MVQALSLVGPRILFPGRKNFRIQLKHTAYGQKEGIKPVINAASNPVVI